MSKSESPNTGGGSAIPTAVLVEPVNVTRKNYSAEAVLKMNNNSKTQQLISLSTLNFHQQYTSANGVIIHSAAQSQGKDWSNSKCRVSNVLVFEDLFFLKYPILKNIDLSNIMIAGGSVSQFINNDTKADDVDLFIYGIKDPEKATARIKRFLCDLEIQYKKYIVKSFLQEERTDNSISVELVDRVLDNNMVDIDIDRGCVTVTKNENMSADLFSAFVNNKFYWKTTTQRNIWSARSHITTTTKTNYSTTVYLDKFIPRNNEANPGTPNQFKIQIISRLYDTSSQILHGFDLGCCCAGYLQSPTGCANMLVTTQLGKFAFEHRLNIIDLDRLSVNHSSRLSKYFMRGFGVVFPDMDNKKFKADIAHNGGYEYTTKLPFINIDKLCRKKQNIYNAVSISVANHTATNNNSSDYGPSSKYIWDIFYTSNSAYKLINDIDELYTTISNANCGIAEILTAVPDKKDLFVKVAKYYKEYLKHKMFSTSFININTLRKYFPMVNIMNVCKMVTNENVNENNASIDQHIDMFIANSIETIKQKIDATDMSKYNGIDWVTKNPESQAGLSGSFNPVKRTVEEWYGKYVQE
jgi:hypothetical protein